MIVAGSPAAYAAKSFAVGTYQQSDGAITVRANGDSVDPYFASRALTLADESGLDVRATAMPWIRWTIEKQLPDGRLQRYCRSSSENWSACQTADADDAGLAVWLELLFRMAPDTGLPSAWQASATRAGNFLETLHDPGSGLYFVSPDLHACLLMDNVEIYHSLRVIATANRRFGRPAQARYHELKARQLARAIVAKLWVPRTQEFRASTQISATKAFYPDGVAQVYPWLFEMPTPAGDPKTAFRRWLRPYRNLWLRRQADQFPWGIVALLAYRMADCATVSRWMASVGPLQGSAYWTVLDETLFQLFEQHPLGVPAPSR